MPAPIYRRRPSRIWQNWTDRFDSVTREEVEDGGVEGFRLLEIREMGGLLQHDEFGALDPRLDGPGHRDRSRGIVFAHHDQGGKTDLGEALGKVEPGDGLAAGRVARGGIARTMRRTRSAFSGRFCTVSAVRKRATVASTIGSMPPVRTASTRCCQRAASPRGSRLAVSHRTSERSTGGLRTAMVMAVMPPIESPTK